MNAKDAIASIRYRIDTASKLVGIGEDGKAFEDLEYAIKAIKERELLPFFIGDNAFVVKNGIVSNVTISSITIDKKNTTYWYDMKEYFGQWKFTNESIGKTVFFTEKEAKMSLNTKKGEM